MRQEREEETEDGVREELREEARPPRATERLRGGGSSSRMQIIIRAVMIILIVIMSGVVTRGSRGTMASIGTRIEPGGGRESAASRPRRLGELRLSLGRRVGLPVLLIV